MSDLVDFFDVPVHHGAQAGSREATRLLEQQALELRIAGATFAQIADRLGFSHRSNARQAVERARQRGVGRVDRAS